MADDAVTPPMPEPTVSETAQIPVNEPLSEPILETTAPGSASIPGESTHPVSDATSEQTPAPADPVQSEPVVQQVEQPTASAAQTAPPSPTSNTSPQAARELLVKARAKIQTRKQQKLDKIMAELEKRGKISNDEVEKLLHCSDATASRYLSELVKQGKIKKVGKTGARVVYVKT